MKTSPRRRSSTGIADKPASSPDERHIVDSREIELKFNAPSSAMGDIRRAIQDAGGTLQRMEARYFDTASGALADHGVSLRLRLEDGRWVQTVKVTDERGGSARWEHEAVVARPVDGRDPDVDASRHAGTVAGQALRHLLEKHAEPLQERYRTKVKRWSCHLQVNQACVAISLDKGSMWSGQSKRRIHEMEFELHRGKVDALTSVCKTWIERHGIWLMSESKSMQGERLLSGEAPPVVKAAPSTVQPGLSCQALLKAVIRDCLAHALPNAAAVAAGSQNADHVHQLRVGLRRLRTALRELRRFSSHSDLASWEAPLARTFRMLGEFRDSEAVVAAISPQLAKKGVTNVPWRRVHADQDPASMVQDSAFQTALACALLYAVADDDAQEDEEPGSAPRRQIKKHLKALHGRLLKDGRRFRKLPTQAQHGVRKRLKRMRYLTEFAQPLFKNNKVNRYLAVMRPAQDELGLHNDYAVALSLLDPRAVPGDGNPASMAAEWLGKRLKNSDHKSKKALRELEGAPRFWKSRI